jgi:hypothetical protein
MPSEDNEEDRRQIIRRLEHRYKESQAQKAQLGRDKLGIEHKTAEIEAALLRAQNPPPGDKICLICWVDNGLIVDREPIRHPVSIHYDRWICRNCGDIKDIRTGIL